jgi:hypothetical protein
MREDENGEQNMKKKNRQTFGWGGEMIELVIGY